MTEHVVRQGDYLSKIAKQYGVADWRILWNDPANAGLRARRKDPNVLYPGDVVVIPDLDDKQVDGSTDKRHSFVVRRAGLELVLVLQRPYDSPLSEVACDLPVEGNQFSGTTDADGRIARPIPPDAQHGDIVLRESGLAIDHHPAPLQIGHLDPVDAPTGQSARLNNLAYQAGPFADCSLAENAVLFDSAVQEFQCDQGLTVDGVCGPATQGKLLVVHGC